MSRTIILAVSTSNQAATLAPVATHLAARGWCLVGLSLEMYFGLPVRWPSSEYLHTVILENPTPCDKKLWDCTPSQLEMLGCSFWFESRKILQALKPSLVVLGNDRGFLERMLIKRARMAGARTVLVQDGVLTGNSLQTPHPSPLSRTKHMIWKIFASVSPERWGPAPFLKSPTPCYGIGDLDALAVSDHHTANLLLQRGIRKERIFVTGQPRFDRLWRIREEAALHQRALAEKYQGRVPVVLATQPMAEWGEVDHDDYRRYLYSILEASCVYRDRMILLIRPHPSEDPASYTRLASAVAPDSSAVVTDWDTQTLTAASAGLITAYSTCALEAIILDRPLLLVNPFRVEQGLPYHAEGVALEIQDLALVQDAIRSVFLERLHWEQIRLRRKTFLDKFVGPLDGCSSERVARLIERVASGSQ